MNVFIKPLSIFALLFPLTALAAGPIDHFEVILSQEEALVDEALDITITAVDKNNETVTDYLGKILVFSESDPEAEFPNDLSENSYTFTTANEGSVKFENAIKFHNPGVQDLYVYDLDDENVLGVAEITIQEGAKEENVDIKIVSPENGITIGKDSVDVSGTTKKNHKVRISVNDKDELVTTSNADGIFEQEVTGLQEGTNTIIAYILDADESTIGESEPVLVKINASLPQFKSIKITPSGEVEAESEISVQVVSNIGLTNVSAIINDIIIQLEEKNDGIYEATTLAPKEVGTYPVDVILKDDFGHDSRERNVDELVVIPALNSGTPGTEEVVVEEIVPKTTMSETQLEELDLVIQNIVVTELKTKSIMTWDKLADAESYNIYKKIGDNKVELIANVKEARYEIPIVGSVETYDDFAIKGVGRLSDGNEVQGDLSEMTKVKTGPELYIFLALLALLLTTGIFFFSKNRA